MMSEREIRALGQAIDTTWGRSSTPQTASYSVKFTLHGNILKAVYGTIVNFATERDMYLMKNRCSEASLESIKKELDVVKEKYSKICGKRLSVKEVASSDSLEVIGFNVHNPKRTSYYRRCTEFEVA